MTANRPSWARGEKGKLEGGNEKTKVSRFETTVMMLADERGVMIIVPYNTQIA